MKQTFARWAGEDDESAAVLGEAAGRDRRAVRALARPADPPAVAGRRAEEIASEPARRERPPARRRTRQIRTASERAVTVDPMHSAAPALPARVAARASAATGPSPASRRRPSRRQRRAPVRGVGDGVARPRSRSSSSSRSTCSRCSTRSPRPAHRAAAHRRAEVRTAARGGRDVVRTGIGRRGGAPTRDGSGAVRRLHRRTRGRAARDGTRSHDEHAR